MSFIITRVTGTVGKPVTVALITSHSPNEIHTPVNVWVEKNFGQWATIEYLETYHVSSISLTDLGVDRLLDVNDLLR